MNNSPLTGQELCDYINNNPRLDHTELCDGAGYQDLNSFYLATLRANAVLRQPEVKPKSKFKTITGGHLIDWEWDENHMFDIELRAEHLIDWFNNIPPVEEEDNEYEFTKWDDKTVLIRYPCPYWWTEVDRDELDLAVLDKLYLKPEWVDAMPCNG